MATPKAKPDPDPPDHYPDQPPPAVAGEAAPPASRVRARFVDVQTVYSPSQGLIGYGDLFEVSAEQLATDPRLIAWSDDWTPTPAALAATTLEG